jgi:hypothetical protein
VLIILKPSKHFKVLTDFLKQVFIYIFKNKYQQVRISKNIPVLFFENVITSSGFVNAEFNVFEQK